MVTKEMERIYQEVADILVAMIPENWRSIVLYAEISGGYSQVFFYYYPLKGKIPVYSVNMAAGFNLDEQKMELLEDQLYTAFERLHHEFTSAGQEPWSNLTFMLDDEGKMKDKFNYDDVSGLNDNEKQSRWEKEYLQGTV